MNIILDIEADGLRPEANVIWCAVALEDDGTTHRFYDGDSVELMTDPDDGMTIDYPLCKFPSFLEECDDICMHNGIEFDRWLINKVFGYLIPIEKVTDTLVLSMLIDQARFQHSVEAYGEQFGMKKQEHEDWSRFSPAMLSRCETDVHLQKKILAYLIKKAEK